MKKAHYFILFLIINFGGLALGSWLMNGGPTSEWYLNLNKAPWSPPGWVFGVAWSIIMLCYSWYLTQLITTRPTQLFWVVFITTVILNIGWNWLFFNQHLVYLALAALFALFLCIAYAFITCKEEDLKSNRYYLLPYLLWLCVAISLNAYVILYNNFTFSF